MCSILHYYTESAMMLPRMVSVLLMRFTSCLHVLLYGAEEVRLSSSTKVGSASTWQCMGITSMHLLCTCHVEAALFKAHSYYMKIWWSG